MKTKSLLFNLIGAILCTLSAPLAAANCYPCSNNCCDWSFCDGKITLGADWLYWKVTQDNLSFGSSTLLASEPNTLPVIVEKKGLTQNFKYDSGFRVNLGYELPGNCWDINICYTYLPSHSKSSTFNTSDPRTFFFNPDFTNFPILNAFNQEELNQPTLVNSKWNLSANNIDVDLGRTICFGECLKIRPHVGFRATWFDQNLRYSAQNILAESPLQQNFNAKLTEKFRACGVEAGLWGQWEVGCGLSVVGHFGGSVLYSKFNVRQSANAANLTVNPGTVTIVTGCDSFRTATPTVDYFLGLQYETCLCDSIFSAHIGWEQHVMFDVNRLARDGNLATQGLTLGLQLGF